MTKVAYFNSSGECHGVAYFALDEDAAHSGGYLVRQSEATPDDEFIETHYLKLGKVRKRSRRPSVFCSWDNEEEKWCEDVNAVRTSCIKSVDAAAESARMQHLTPGSGQSMTYEVKYQEALAGGGPMLQAEADALGVTLQEVVDSVLGARQAWLVVGGRIEAARLKAKKAIRESQTAAEIYAIEKAFLEQL